jgi:hypothetical protein
MTLQHLSFALRIRSDALFTSPGRVIRGASGGRAEDYSVCCPAPGSTCTSALPVGRDPVRPDVGLGLLRAIPVPDRPAGSAASANVLWTSAIGIGTSSMRSRLPVTR